MKSFFLIPLTLALTLASCMQAPQGDRVAADGTFVINEKTKGVALSVDTLNSHIEWLGTKPGGTHFGTVKLSGGTVYVDNGKVTGGTFTINLKSIAVDDIKEEAMNKALVNHLLSPDFFLVDSFPNAEFQIAQVQLADESTSTYSVSGNLTVRGTTKGITFTTEIKVDNNRVSVASPQFVINRTHWNVNYGSQSVFANLKDNFIHDEIGLKVKLVAKN